MKNKTIAGLAAASVIVAAGGYGLYTLGVQRGMESAPAAAPAAPQTDKKVLYWHDPMVPTQKFDKPGKSPFMDMQLVPVYAGEAADEGTVSISPRVQQNLGIRTAEVRRGALAPTVEAVGSVAYNERELALVQARANGFIERLHVRAPLDPVRKGQPLAELYVPDWVAAQEEYLSVRRMGSGAGTEGLVDAARQRMRLAGMSDAQIARVETSGKAQARMTITAPVSGVVSELDAREGMTVMAGAPLFRINGVGTVWVNAELPESLASQVRPGSVVEGRTPALPGLVFKGKVGAILPQVDQATRTLKARIEMANPQGQLVPGMFVTLSASSARRGEVLLVPSEALIRTGTRTVVMTAEKDGAFRPAQVETGVEANGQTEIRKGLEAGQKVVVSGQFLIDSEASLKGTVARMSEPDAPQPGTAAAHRASGTLEQVDKDEITISHGPVPSLKWGAMTMGFEPPATGLPPGLKPGAQVEFEFIQTAQGTFRIQSIAPAAHEHKTGAEK
jgi:Cu(I)/Ag(I) efflux system membrane fusion protein